jgi:hypothetical protein
MAICRRFVRTCTLNGTNFEYSRAVSVKWQGLSGLNVVSKAAKE